MINGSRIKDERLKRGMSQEQLGDLLDVTKVSVCGYENGTRTPTMETFLKLIDILEVEPNYLLGRDVNVVCEEDEQYVRKMSKNDLDIIDEIKKHPKLYAKLSQSLNRTVNFIERKIRWYKNYLFFKIIIWLKKYNMLYLCSSNDYKLYLTVKK